MSIITNIYNALDAKTVTTTSGVTPTIYNLDELPESITTAHLPCRLLLPVGNNPTEALEGQFIAIGTTVTVNWQVSDLMLWQASEQGIGLREFAPELVDYCGKYVDMCRSFKCPYPNSVLEGFTVTPGEYEWPRGSGRFYAGVLAQLVVKEVLNG
jgi:hypothetical protein